MLLSLSQQEGTCPLSEIRVTTISDTAGTGPVTLTKQSAAKSFINHFEGTTINGSFNTSSLTDHGTGDHSHSFINNHNDIYYAATGSVISDSTVQTNTSTHSVITAGGGTSTCVHSTSALRYKVIHMSNTAKDHQMVQTVTHGDLA